MLAKYGILCSGPGEWWRENPPPTLIQLGDRVWCWYHDFSEKILYETRESAEREAANARTWHREWKYQVVATE